MYEFLLANKVDLVQRCRDKVTQRPGRSPSSVQLRNGIPMFLDQLIRTLQVEQTSTPLDSRAISGQSEGATTLSEVGASAAQHGQDLLDIGYSVDEVVHDYGDLCQAITDLAVDHNVPFEIDEFRTLNRCLDNAISEAVTEFSYQQGLAIADKVTNETNVRADFFAHELREMLGTAALAFSAAKAGQLSLAGATGSILERSLNQLSILIDRSVIDIGVSGRQTTVLSSFSLALFIGELASLAQPAVNANICELSVAPVDDTLALSGNREVLLFAVAYLLDNAINVTVAGTKVILDAYASADKIKIDISDDAQRKPSHEHVTEVPTLANRDANRTAAGLGLTVARQSITAMGGTLSLSDLPVGYTFSISLPRHAMPT